MHTDPFFSLLDHSIPFFGNPTSLSSSRRAPRYSEADAYEALIARERAMAEAETRREAEIQEALRQAAAEAEARREAARHREEKLRAAAKLAKEREESRKAAEEKAQAERLEKAKEDARQHNRELCYHPFFGYYTLPIAEEQKSTASGEEKGEGTSVTTSSLSSETNPNTYVRISKKVMKYDPEKGWVTVHEEVKESGKPPAALEGSPSDAAPAVKNVPAGEESTSPVATDGESVMEKAPSSSDPECVPSNASSAVSAS